MLCELYGFPLTKDGLVRFIILLLPHWTVLSRYLNLFQHLQSAGHQCGRQGHIHLSSLWFEVCFDHSAEVTGIFPPKSRNVVISESQKSILLFRSFIKANPAKLAALGTR